jgi:fatty acid desaturase
VQNSSMMVLSANSPDSTLPQYLTHRAGATSVLRLSADVLLGATLAAAALWLRPVAWIFIASAALALASYGAWALSHRARSSRLAAKNRAVRLTLVILSFLAAAAGVFACSVFLYATWALALGTWIS